VGNSTVSGKVTITAITTTSGDNSSNSNFWQNSSNNQLAVTKTEQQSAVTKTATINQQ